MTKTIISKSIDESLSKIDKFQTELHSLKMSFEILKEEIEAQQMIGPGLVSFGKARIDIKNILNDYESSHTAVSKICGYLKDMHFIKI